MPFNRCKNRFQNETAKNYKEKIELQKTMGGNKKFEAYRKAMNLNLVPRGPPTSTSSPTTAPTVIDQSRIFLLAVNENAS